MTEQHEQHTSFATQSWWWSSPRRVWPCTFFTPINFSKMCTAMLPLPLVTSPTDGHLWRASCMDVSLVVALGRASPMVPKSTSLLFMSTAACCSFAFAAVALIFSYSTNTAGEMQVKCSMSNVAGQSNAASQMQVTFTQLKARCSMHSQFLMSARTCTISASDAPTFSNTAMTSSSRNKLFTLSCPFAWSEQKLPYAAIKVSLSTSLHSSS